MAVGYNLNALNFLARPPAKQSFVSVLVESPDTFLEFWVDVGVSKEGLRNEYCNIWPQHMKAVTKVQPCTSKKLR